MTSDDSQNLPEHVVPRELAIVEFDGGNMVRTMVGKLPAITMDMPYGYQYGTHLKFELEVRVRGATTDENRKGELVRTHHFALEELKLVGAYTAAQAEVGVGGSAAASAPDAEADSDTRPNETQGALDGHDHDPGF